MIKLTKIYRIYETGNVKVPALQNINLEINEGEFLAIMGHSGSGKSTMLNILGMLDKPTSGSFKLFGREITSFNEDELSLLRNRIAGFVFQQFYLLPRVTVKENVQLPFLYSCQKEGAEAIEDNIGKVNLQHRIGHISNELSGGEQQRVAIARALACGPYIIFADEPTGNLDTKTSDEIISILEDLNKQGKTVVIVTHEEEVASRANRIIRMRDGEIISDTLKKKGKKKNPNKDGTNLENILSDTDRRIGKREVVNFVKQAVGSVVSHKLRSFLSILGILIGVMAVITILAIGSGAKEDISTRLSSLGSNLLKIMPGAARSHGVSYSSGTALNLTLEDSSAIQKLPEVNRVSPNIFGAAQLVYRNKNWNTRIQGAGPFYAEITASQPMLGVFFDENDVRIRKRVAVIGPTIVRELFDNTDPVGSTIKINKSKYRVIGVLPSKGSSPWRDRDDLVVIPISTAMYRLIGRDHLHYIDAEIKKPELIEGAKESIKRLLFKRHNVDEESNSFNIRDMTEIREAVDATTRTLSWLLGSIASISLIVGGIGIMNIMLVTVKERTREIGLRKAIGARKRDIMLQFLVESILLTFIGGITGIILGSVISFILASLAGWAVKITLYSIVLSTLFSVFVGLVFGLWPALQAARLKPVEALRYE